MKIGIIYDDIEREGLDCSQPQLGNPGVGGTQYCYLMLLYYYAKQFPMDQLIIYRYRIQKYVAKMPAEGKIIYKLCKSADDCVRQASLDSVDILLFTVDHIVAFSSLLLKYKIKSIVWVHNWIRGKILKTLAHHPFVCKVVFLVTEHYDRYIDHPVIAKGVIIPNMFNVKGYPSRNVDSANLNVTYVGALVPGKGFDRLAKAWPAILSKVPDAQLYIIGQGNLYGEGICYGKFGIAQENFEKKFTPYITDPAGNLLPSVHFMGLMGTNKIDIYKKTKVGVVNPSGQTEVCPISALEMQAASIPVVSADTNGIPDVIKHGRTGLLASCSVQVPRLISSLLLDNHKNLKMGEEAHSFVAKNFVPEKLVLLWKETFQRAHNDEPEKVVIHFRHLTNNYKWMRIINYYLKKLPFFCKFPAVIDIEAQISLFIRGK